MKTLSLFLSVMCATGLSLFGQSNPGTTTNAESPGGKIQLPEALLVYSKLTTRTVLQHPALKRISLSFSNTTDKAQQLAALEESFRQNGIVTIPDGDKFVMVVPEALTNSAKPRSIEIAPAQTGGSSSSEKQMPAGMIDWQNLPLQQALMIYADFAGRRLDPPGRLPMVQLNLQTSTALSKAEICYALETLFSWSGIKMVPTGEKSFKVE